MKVLHNVIHDHAQYNMDRIAYDREFVVLYMFAVV